jgi:uncharacterized protein YndB with AHSA1/START domain
MGTASDRIEKKILLRAPRARVWRALSDSKEFGLWFGAELAGPFAPGRLVRGIIKPTTVDDDVAAKQRPHEGKPWEITIERVEPERLLSFRWHPFAIDPEVDYSSEPTTLVVFELEEVPGGTMLTVSESGFEGIPLERRAKAFEANDHGWALQAGLIDKYVRAAA